MESAIHWVHFTYLRDLTLYSKFAVTMDLGSPK